MSPVRFSFGAGDSKIKIPFKTSLQEKSHRIKYDKSPHTTY
jgi:hypothetical protein